MAKTIRTSDTRVTKICPAENAVRRVPGKQVAAALGAEAVEGAPIPHGSPIALLAIREEIHRRLRSRGGRPSLDKTLRRQKIPITDEEWAKLQRLAARLGSQRMKVTPGQLASLLLHRSLEQLDESELASAVRTTSTQ
ncbi:hypothetical protein JXA88_05600 [Candidatus Fermentibacteria bacterium]|nr:hypothetical protein [Candidatus Fermentibacteria bacterium]